MDLVVAMLVLLSLVALTVVPVIAIIALVKANRVETELKRLVDSLERGELTPVEPEASEVYEVVRASVKDEEPHTPMAQQSEPARTVPLSTPVEVPKTSVAKVNWEQWVGIRGAAVVGGLLLALAGLLFFKHALDQGWVTPFSRVVTGTVVGLFALALGEVFQRREFRFAPAAVAGGGIVVLYATTWAAYKLYGFIPALVALPLMGGVTAMGVGASVRLRSQLVAILGLMGGFATPLLLSMPADNPIGLFGYILLLDLGLLALGLRTKWPALGILAMLGTFLIELVWALRHLDAHFFPLAIGSLGAFALVFVAAGQRSAGSERRGWLASQAGALLLPFAFAAYFAAVTDFGRELWPLATLIAFLVVGAGWVARTQNVKWLVTAAASGALAVTATWLARTGVSDGQLWEFTLCTLGLSLEFTAVDRLFGRSQLEEGEVGSVAPMIVSGGFAIMTVLAAVFFLEPSPWPWLFAALGQALILHRQGRAAKAGGLRLAGASLAGLTMSLYLIDAAHTSVAGVPSSGVTVAWMIGASVVFILLALWSDRADEEREAKFAWIAASLFPLVLLALSPASCALIGPNHFAGLGIAVALAVLALIPAVTRGLGSVSLGTMILFAFARAGWLLVNADDSGALTGAFLAAELAALLLLACVPLVTRCRLGASRLAWAGSGILLLGSWSSTRYLFGSYFGRVGHWRSAAVLGSLAILVGGFARWRLGPAGKARDSAASWLFGVGSVLLAMAVARGVNHEVLVVGTALAGLALAALWRKWPSIGLRACSILLVSFAATRLLGLVGGSLAGNSHFENGSLVVLNWTSYGTGLPVICALSAALLFRADGDEGRSRTGTYLGLMAGLLAFVWLNLQVFLYFESGPLIRLSLDSLPARDLTLSIAWILYALLLLAAGMARHVSALRQVSLAFLLLTLMKVFLHDLGDLEGLYRVGSLFGLAVSLLLVSMLYQRFVFPGSRKIADE